MIVANARHHKTLVGRTIVNMPQRLDKTKMSIPSRMTLQLIGTGHAQIM
jgi:hypothetical protein